MDSQGSGKGVSNIIITSFTAGVSGFGNSLKSSFTRVHIVDLTHWVNINGDGLSPGLTAPDFVSKLLNKTELKVKRLTPRTKKIKQVNIDMAK